MLHWLNCFRIVRLMFFDSIHNNTLVYSWLEWPRLSGPRGLIQLWISFNNESQWWRFQSNRRTLNIHVVFCCCCLSVCLFVVINALWITTSIRIANGHVDPFLSTGKLLFSPNGCMQKIYWPIFYSMHRITIYIYWMGIKCKQYIAIAIAIAIAITMQRYMRKIIKTKKSISPNVGRLRSITTDIYALAYTNSMYD